MTSTATDSDKLAALKAFSPRWMAGMWESAYATDGMVPDERNRGRGIYERSPAEWRTKQITGKPSLKERRHIEKGYQVKESERRASSRKADITELAADFYQKEGFIDSDLMVKAMDEGYSTRQFRRLVKELVKERETSRLGRLAGGKKRTPTRDRVHEQIEDMMDDLSL
jgi:hypothetical protein